MKYHVCRFCHCHYSPDLSEQKYPVWVIEIELPTLSKVFAICSCPCHFYRSVSLEREEAFKEAYNTIFGGKK